MDRHQFRILSIDGGGIKGIIPCIILEAMENHPYGAPVHQLFDLIAGTSTGGILALGLSKPKPFKASEMLDLYRLEGRNIFSRRRKDIVSAIVGKIPKIGKDAKAALQRNYDVSGLEKALAGRFGQSRLSNVATEVLVTTYDVDKGEPFYFSSRLAKQKELAAREDFELAEVARSTSAAPTYFEPNIIRHAEHDNMVTVDGGVFANNPSALAYAEAKEIWKSRMGMDSLQPAPGQEDAKGYIPVVTPDDLDLPFVMVSLTCGESKTTVSAAQAAKWRAAKWFEPLLTDVFMRSVSESTHYLMEHLMPPYLDGEWRYKRVPVPLPPESSEMDDVSPENINRLIATGRAFVQEHPKLIDDILSKVG